MKIILSIIFMFFTAQSFADLNDKGVLCSYDKKGSTPYAYYFNRDDSTYFIRYILKKNDAFIITECCKSYYSTDEDFIYITDFKISRKTLTINNKNYEEKLGTCEVFNTHKSLDLKLKMYKDKYQERYNKKLEGNKI